MKKKILYTCEQCNTDYASQSDAAQCEANHSKILTIINHRSLPYSQDKSGFPVAIEVQDEKGNKVTYKR